MNSMITYMCVFHQYSAGRSPGDLLYKRLCRETSHSIDLSPQAMLVLVLNSPVESSPWQVTESGSNK